jgi:hypothetical protein
MSVEKALPLKFKILAGGVLLLVVAAILGGFAALSEGYENRLAFRFKSADRSPVEFSMAASERKTSLPMAMGLEMVSLLSDTDLVSSTWPPPGRVSEVTGLGEFEAAVVVEQNHPSLGIGRHVLHVRVETQGVVQKFALEIRGELDGAACAAYAGEAADSGKRRLKSQTHLIEVVFSKP